jgi:ParB/RepB/Spo0J family partition protein
MEKIKQAQSRLATVDPARVKPFVGQPRSDFRNIAQLARSIKTFGQRQPIEVTTCDLEGYDYELIDGERRLQACLHANIPIEVIVRPEPEDRFAVAVMANFHAQKHNCLEIAAAVNRLSAHGKTVKEIAEIFGKSTCYVMQHANLCRLHPEIRPMLVAPCDKKRERAGGSGRLTFSLAQLLVPLPQEMQLELAKRITAAKMGMSEARRFIMGASRTASVRVGAIQSPKDHVVRLLGFMKQIRARVGEYLDMPAQEFDRLYKGCAKKDREAIAASVDATISDLIQLLDSFAE